MISNARKYEIRNTPPEMLRARASEIMREYERIGRWRAFAGTDLGKAMVEQLDREIAEIRALYSGIVPHDPAALTALSGLQGEERMAARIKARLGNYEILKKSLDEEMAFINSVLNK